MDILFNSSLFHTFDFVKLLANLEAGASVWSYSVDGITVYGIETNKRGIKQLQILPFGLYMPLLQKDSLDKFLHYLVKLKSEYAHILINLPPFAEFDLSNSYLGFKVEKHTCHILQLNKSLPEIISAFSDTRQKHIKRYKKNGSLNIFCTTEKQYFRKYYEVYQDTLKRWGENYPAYSFELITSLSEIPNVRMWVAEYQGEMISGMICFYGESSVFDWLAASIINEDLKKLYAAVAVQYSVIEDAHQKGLNFVNMGASDMLKGVHEFKDSWSAISQNYYSLQYRSLSFQILKKIQSFLLRLT